MRVAWASSSRRQDQPGRDQRIGNGAARGWDPAVELLQQRQIVIDDIVTDQASRFIQARKPLLNLVGPEFLDPVATEFGNNDAVNFSDGIEQSIAFNVEECARRFDFGRSGPDERPG
jgi:hypothetical protein